MQDWTFCIFKFIVSQCCLQPLCQLSFFVLSSIRHVVTLNFFPKLVPSLESFFLTCGPITFFKEESSPICSWNNFSSIVSTHLIYFYIPYNTYNFIMVYLSLCKVCPTQKAFHKGRTFWLFACFWVPIT